VTKTGRFRHQIRSIDSFCPKTTLAAGVIERFRNRAAEIAGHSVKQSALVDCKVRQPVTRQPVAKVCGPLIHLSVVPSETKRRMYESHVPREHVGSNHVDVLNPELERQRGFGNVE